MSKSTIPRSMQKRTTVTLFVSQSLFSASTIISFTLMPIISAHLSGTDRAAGVPPTMMLLGRAIAAYPVGWLMDRIGRRLGLSLGYLLATVGAMLSMLSISIWGSFAGFCAGGMLIGMGRGASEQARFIAAEVYPSDRRAGVIGMIVFAGTVGAVAGPLLVDPSTELAASFGLHVNAGPYLVSAAFTALALVLTFSLLRPDPMMVGRTLAGDLNSREENASVRALRQIFSDGTVRLSVAAMVIGQLVMTLTMVITPLHMAHHAHGTKAISWVIMAHTLGMFGLSSMTSRLSDYFGRVRIVIAGALVLAVSAVLTPISNQLPMLAFALFLLGLGWNFCFIAGSALLSGAVLPFERGRAQGITEMMVSLAAATGSLGTGTVFAEGGIVAVSAIGLGFSLALMGWAIRWIKTR